MTVAATTDSSPRVTTEASHPVKLIPRPYRTRLDIATATSRS